LEEKQNGRDKGEYALTCFRLVLGFIPEELGKAMKILKPTGSLTDIRSSYSQNACADAGCCSKRTLLL
jgi:hypothetical protein